MSTKTNAIIIAFAALVSGWIGYSYGPLLLSEQHYTIYSSLRTVSSIILGITGVWIAILFPNIIQQTYNASSSTKTLENSTFTKLTTALISSLSVVAISLIIEIAGPILSTTLPSNLFIKTIKRLSLAAAVFLSMVQLTSFLLVLVPLDHIKSRSDKASQKKKIRDAQHSLQTPRDEQET